MRTYVRLGLLLAIALALTVVAGRGTPAYAWSYPAALNTNAATDSGGDRQPQVTTDGAGHWLAVWQSNENVGGTIGTDDDILVARSIDDGATWTAPAALNTNAATDSGDDWYPQVTTDGAGNWVAVWASRDDLGGTIGTDLDILVARSTDNGGTWTAPVALNTNAATDSREDGPSQVTTDGAGNWVAVWRSDIVRPLGARSEGDIMVARSTDDGATWTAPEFLNTDAASDVESDTDPQVATDGAGHWVAVWTSAYDSELFPPHYPSDSDILVARSTDNGTTWTAPELVNTNSPMEVELHGSPQVATDGAGHWVAVWHFGHFYPPDTWEETDILVARSTNNGATWTAPAALNTNAATDSGDDWEPQVTTDGAGKWVAVWDSLENLGGAIGTDTDILVAQSTDNGVTWTAPAALNTNAATEAGRDASPQVATDGAGNWVAVWDSWDDLSGTIGTDFDILYATEFQAPPPPTPTPPAGVGGIVELQVDGSDSLASPADGPDAAGLPYAAIAAGAAAALVALGAGGWYARRRFSRG
ncbi:MAG: glycoside hydrolase [Dehalococcoidia bacterium]|nr:glycoside hydrolase [Dehalococcoidia bacterium]